MLRRVMAAISSFSPAKAASSSSVSPVTMVLSMSAISSPLRRPRALVVMASTAAPSSAAAIVAGSGGALTKMSAASPGESRSVGPPPTASRTRAIRAGESVVAARSAIRVRTWLMARLCLAQRRVASVG